MRALAVALAALCACACSRREESTPESLARALHGALTRGAPALSLVADTRPMAEARYLAQLPMLAAAFAHGAENHREGQGETPSLPPHFLERTAVEVRGGVSAGEAFPEGAALLGDGVCVRAGEAPLPEALARPPEAQPWWTPSVRAMRERVVRAAARARAYRMRCGGAEVLLTVLTPATAGGALRALEVRGGLRQESSPPRPPSP